MKTPLRALRAIALLFSAYAASAQTITLALTQQSDINGKPPAGSLLYALLVMPPARE